MTLSRRWVTGLALSGLCFRWSEEEPFLFDGLSLSLASGSVTALVGRSGCGKSTLLRLAAGLLPPSEGTVDRPGTEGPGDVAFVFQSPTLLPWRSLEANVALPLELSKAPPALVEERVSFALSAMGLLPHRHKLPGALSGGMQMRASLARALVTRPVLLLMDEPFAALDALTRREAWVAVQEVWAETGATALLVTHDIDEAVLLSDEVLVLGGQPVGIRGQVRVDLPWPRKAQQRFDPEVAALVAQVEALL